MNHQQQISVVHHNQQNQRPSDRDRQEKIGKTTGNVSHAQLANPGALGRRDEEVEPQEGAQEQDFYARHEDGNAHGGEVDEVGSHGRHGEAKDGDGQEAFEELELGGGGDEKVEALGGEVGADDFEEEDGEYGDFVI